MCVLIYITGYNINTHVHVTLVLTQTFYLKLISCPLMTTLNMLWSDNLSCSSVCQSDHWSVRGSYCLMVVDLSRSLPSPVSKMRSVAYNSRNVTECIQWLSPLDPAVCSAHITAGTLPSVFNGFLRFTQLSVALI